MTEHEWCDKEISELQERLSDKSKALIDANSKIRKLECDLSAVRVLNDIRFKENVSLKSKTRYLTVFLLTVLLIITILNQ